MMRCCIHEAVFDWMEGWTGCEIGMHVSKGQKFCCFGDDFFFVNFVLDEFLLLLLRSGVSSL